MKKGLALIVAGLSALLLSACGGTVSTSTQPSSTSSGPSTTSVTPSTSTTPTTGTTSVHVHTFSPEWTSNDTHHWHAATCEHTELKDSYEEHAFVPDEYGIEEICKCGKRRTLISELDAPTNVACSNVTVSWDAVTNALAYEVKVISGESTVLTKTVESESCDVSEVNHGDYDISVVAKRGPLVSEPAILEDALIKPHTFDTEWSKNGTHHWHAATCKHTDEKSDYAEHVFVPDQYGIEEVCVCGEKHTLISSLDAPTGLAYASENLTWNAVTNALTYDVNVKQGESSVLTKTVETTSCDVSTLEPGDYEVFVTAKRGPLASTASSLTFTILYLDGIAKIEAEDGALNSKHISYDAQASGGAYALALDDCGQGLYFRYYAFEAGNREVTVTYSTGMDDPKHSLYLNGSKSQDVVYEENTGWFGDTHVSAKAKVTVNGFVLGWNELYLKVDAASNYVQIDYLEISGTNKSFDVKNFDFTVNTMNLQAECFNFHYNKKDTRPVSGDSAKFQFGYFLGAIDNEGDGGKLQYTAPCSGKYEIVVGYAADGARDVAVSINGAEASIANISGSTAWDDVVARKVGTITLVENEAFSIDVYRPSTGSWFCFDYINLVRVVE